MLSNSFSIFLSEWKTSDFLISEVISLWESWFTLWIDKFLTLGSTISNLGRALSFPKATLLFEVRGNA